MQRAILIPFLILRDFKLRLRRSANTFLLQLAFPRISSGTEGFAFRKFSLVNRKTWSALFFSSCNGNVDFLAWKVTFRSQKRRRYASRVYWNPREHWWRSQSRSKWKKKIGTELRVAAWHVRRASLRWRATLKALIEMTRGSLTSTQIINWNSVTQMLRACTYYFLCSVFDAFAHGQTTVSVIPSWNTDTRPDSIVFIDVN